MNHDEMRDLANQTLDTWNNGERVKQRELDRLAKYVLVLLDEFVRLEARVADVERQRDEYERLWLKESRIVDRYEFGGTER